MMPKTETSALRAHQLALLQMLHEIDRVCKKHHITYTLFAGTVPCGMADSSRGMTIWT